MTQVDRRVSQDTRDKQVAKADVFFNATMAQIDTYIENNVTDLASAKDVLKKLAKLVSILSKDGQ